MENLNRTWHDVEIHFPKVNNRFIQSMKESWLTTYPWYAFSKEIKNDKLVLYILWRTS